MKNVDNRSSLSIIIKESKRFMYGACLSPLAIDQLRNMNDVKWSVTCFYDLTKTTFTFLFINKRLFYIMF